VLLGCLTSWQNLAASRNTHVMDELPFPPTAGSCFHQAVSTKSASEPHLREHVRREGKNGSNLNNRALLGSMGNFRRSRPYAVTI
jgi:hypothetical protein